MLYSKNNIDDAGSWVINLLNESILLMDHNLISSGLEFLELSCIRPSSMVVVVSRIHVSRA
jgi:hypothetical protein